MRPKEGERYIVRRAFTATAMTHWEAPYTGGARCEVPEGIIFKIDYEPPAMASAVGCVPEDAAAWEARFVSAADRAAPKYAGYSLSLDFDDIARCCARL